ncbi:beta-lactamase [Steroidobacter agaridevorans]|uniref:Beta-lactamase n=1 Tax=Steroidobacter agaridevorans TaxID=2695856 RepID=A0A829YAA5_9GAMM|nr:class A beta-lactamase [Steroidobacter agaridevorans]GFE79923.1 beta-lactamase [Steroidobacter agaridevorans]
MKHGLRRWQLALMLCVMSSLQTVFAAPVLEAEIARLTAPIGGKVGVAAWQLDGKGERIMVNAGERFPMASTFKIAVAGAILASVDAGRLQLDQLVAVQPNDIVPSDGIASLAIHPGISLSVHNLLELMLTLSDNTATDVLTRLAGGPQAVTGWVRKQGVEEQRIDRDTAGILREFFNLPPGPFNEALQEAVKQDPQLEERGNHPNAAFDKDVRDTSTPAAMGQLLTKIFNQQALSVSSTKVLIDIMQRCHTGAGRLPGRMPAGTVIAHKTGTIGGTVNDVGVMTLPDGKSQIVIAVFIKESDKPMEQRERVIAEIARSVRDYFLLAGAS